MGADILDELELMRFTRIDPIRENAILKRAKDEIGRLRGEVAMTEQQKADRDLLLTGTSFMRDGKRIDPATVRIETPAPAMPNGVEDMHDDLSTPDLLNEAERIAVNQYKDGRYAAARILRILCHRLRAADNRDAAGVDSEEDAYVIERMGKLLAEIAVIVNGPEPDMTRWSYHDLPEKVRALKTTPAAVPAGEAVAVCGTCNGVGMIGGHRGQTPDSFEQWAEDCPDCTPQPADGEAVAPLGYVRRKAISAMREDDEVTGIMVHVDAPSDSVPVYLHPPAPVQAAPQEGEDEPEDVREIIARDKRVWALAGLAEKCGAVKDEGESGLFWTLALGDFYKLEAALQHRGDSQEVGRG